MYQKLIFAHKEKKIKNKDYQCGGLYFLYCVEQVCKPGSVLDDYLSRPYITIWLKPPPDTGTSGRLSLYKPIRCCFEWGLHSRYVTVALVSSYLTFPPSPKLAVYFCCTVLRVASTGSYPAPLPFEARTFLVNKIPAIIWLTQRKYFNTK